MHAAQKEDEAAALGSSVRELEAANRLRRIRDVDKYGRGEATAKIQTHVIVAVV